MRDHINRETTTETLAAASLFELAGRQCDLSVRATAALTAYLENGGKQATEQVEQPERTADHVSPSSVDSNTADRMPQTSDALSEMATRVASGQTPNWEAA